MNKKNLFIKHSWDFINSTLSPGNQLGRHAIAVSSGVDSMVLLWLANNFYRQGKLGKVRAFFVHHHTRAGQDQELKLVQKFTREIGLELVVLHAKDLNKGSADFEQKARVARYQLFKKNLNPGEFLWMGHHLDDSFEWSLMQRSRSSHFKSQLGIPLRNKFVFRPLLCVSRKQIENFAKEVKIPYAEDPTNKDIHHDRNYLRLKVIPIIKKRFPQYLKHYVRQSMNLARILKVCLVEEKEAEVLSTPSGAVLFGSEYLDSQLQMIIHTYSHADRGQVMGTIHSMQKAIKNGKKGPFSFSGGVKAYYSHELLMVFHESFVNADEEWAKILDSLTEEQFNSSAAWSLEEFELEWMKLLESEDSLKYLPLPVLVLEPRNIQKTLKTSRFDPLFPKVSEVLVKRDWHFIMARKLIENWPKDKNMQTKKLKIVPLTQITHLLSSQASNTLL